MQNVRWLPYKISPYKTWNLPYEVKLPENWLVVCTMDKHIEFLREQAASLRELAQRAPRIADALCRIADQLDANADELEDHRRGSPI